MTVYYMAASDPFQEMWMKIIIGGLLQTEVWTTIYDNEDEIQLIKNSLYHKQTKHIEVRYDYVQEQYKLNGFPFRYISSRPSNAILFLLED